MNYIKKTRLRIYAAGFLKIVTDTKYLKIEKNIYYVFQFLNT